MADKTVDVSGIMAKLANAAAKMENPKFDSTNPHFKSKFASLGAVIAAIKPALTAEGLMFRQTCEGQSVDPWLVTYVYDGANDMELSRVPLAMSADPQKQGSAITYAKRYGLCAAFGLVGEEDDDANKASETPTAAPKPAPKASTPPKPQSAPQQASTGSDERPMTLEESKLAFKAAFVRFRDYLPIPDKEQRTAEAKRRLTEAIGDVSLEDSSATELARATAWLTRQVGSGD